MTEFNIALPVFVTLIVKLTRVPLDPDEGTAVLFTNIEVLMTVTFDELVAETLLPDVGLPSTSTRFVRFPKVELLILASR